MNISLGKPEDINDIMSFIESDWGKNHILSRDQLFFKYEYLYDNQINFVFARENNEIVGLLGFIPSSISYNSIYGINNNSDYCATLWKVRENLTTPTVGLQLLESIRNLKNMGNLFCVGINKKTIGIHKYLGIYTDTMQHYAMINESIQEFKIAKVKESRGAIVPTNSSIEKYAIKIVKDETELLKFKFDNFEQNIPYKNAKYFTKRYFAHPVYKYDVFGVYNSGDLEGLFVTRIEACNGSRALRIVDFFGDEKNITPFAVFLSNLIKKEKYEYADFYCFGLDENNLLNSGFQLIDPHNEELIIPNYFNPFLQKNIPIHFFADTKKVNLLRLFKADGDQDRPS